MQRSDLRRSQGFLDPHHIETAQRISQLYERAHLRQRTTMRYSPMPAAGKNTGLHGEVSDMAADARKALSEIRMALPAECAAVVFDVCCYEKGLQTVEAERGWPRRSAKLVLRIGLEHLAEKFGLSAAARGPRTATQQTWIDKDGRPQEIG